MRELRQKVPNFLAYIELFGMKDDIRNLTYSEIQKTRSPSIGSGTLINTQYILT